MRRLRGPAEPGTDAWVASDDAGDMVAAWRGSGARGALVQATVGTLAGHLSAPQTLDRDPTAPDLLGVPLVAMSPDGVAVVVWTEPPPPRGGDGKVLASFRAAGADRFGAPVQVAASPSFSRVLAVAAGAAGRALVAIGGFPRGQHVTVLEGTAGGFAAPADLGAPRGAPTQAAATLGPDGAATLAWSAGGAIQVATRAAGAGFAPIATVSTAGVPAGRTLSLAARDGRVALAWAEADVRRTVARMIVADGSVGARLGTPRALTLRRGSIGDLRLALGDRGAAGLAWRLTCSPNNSRVLSASRRPGATRFDAETVASGKDRSARAPAVAIGPRSRPTVAWVAGPRPPAKAVVRVAVPRR